MPGSHQAQFIDVLHRSHTGVEDRVRADKAMGCDADLARAKPQTLRYWLWHLPARLVEHARQRIVKISANHGDRVPHLPAALVRPTSARLTSPNTSRRRQEGVTATPSGPVEAAAH
ncbi:hypothetical protein [Planotetraspora sp. GP83]|uniref:hypothetical protein n=1 Tax=Planotetraspora sp. GP83 TaxID=3156264 RepID=UPI003517D32E